MLVRLRLTVPDRPGSLGLVTSAIGESGAGVHKVDVLHAEAGRATDDITVDVRDERHLDRLRAGLGGLPGVELDGVLSPAPPVDGHAELELVRAVLADPVRGVRTLVDGAPAAVGADWAAVLEFAPDGPVVALVAASPAHPGPDAGEVVAPLRLGTVRLADASGRLYGGAALVPLGRTPLGLLVVRVAGPAFHRSEVWRLGEIGGIVGSAVAVPTTPATSRTSGR